MKIEELFLLALEKIKNRIPFWNFSKKWINKICRITKKEIKSDYTQDKIEKLLISIHLQEYERFREKLIEKFKLKYKNVSIDDIEIVVDSKLEILCISDEFNPDIANEDTYLNNIIDNGLKTEANKNKGRTVISEDIEHDNENNKGSIVLSTEDPDFEISIYLSSISLNEYREIFKHLSIIKPYLAKKMKEDREPLPINHIIASKDFLFKDLPVEFEFLKKTDDFRINIPGYLRHEKIIYSKERQFMNQAIILLKKCRENFHINLLPKLIAKEMAKNENGNISEFKIKESILKKIPVLSAIATDKENNIVKTKYKGETGCMNEHCEYNLFTDILNEKDKERLVKGTLYVTLEPCNKRGIDSQTGGPKIPCAVRCVEAGISRIYIGTYDPDKKVNWRGAETLQTGQYKFELDENKNPIGENSEKEVARLLMNDFDKKGYKSIIGNNFKIYQIGNPVEVKLFHLDFALKAIILNREFIGNRVKEALTILK